MKKIALIILSICMLSACRSKSGSGNIITETRNPGSFTGISVAGDFEVELKQGPAEQVIVEADDNLMKYIDTKISGSQLQISLIKIDNVRNAHLKVYVSAPEINNIKASASASVKAKDMLKSAQKISLQSSSGSSIKTSLDAPEVTADASSGGELTLSGRTKDFRAETTSGSNINATELLSENGFISASSGATAHIYASMNLEAKASSGANISYRGAAYVKKTVNSGGEVEKVN